MGTCAPDDASARAAYPTVSTVCAAAGPSGPGSWRAADAAPEGTRLTRVGPGDGPCPGPGSRGPGGGRRDPPRACLPTGVPVLRPREPLPGPPEPPCHPDPPDGPGCGAGRPLSPPG